MRRASELFDQAISADPNNPVLRSHIAAALMSFGAVKAAHQVLAASTRTFPTHPGTLNDHAAVMLHMGLVKEAMQCWQQAMKLDPNFVAAPLNLGNLLQRLGRPDDAEGMLRLVLARQPSDAGAWRALAHIRRDLGDIDDAIHCFERAIDCRPEDQSAQSALLFTLLFQDGIAWSDVVKRHVAWSARCADRFSTASSSYNNDRSPDRPLRVGYVAPFFTHHVATDLIEPVLAQHDRSQFELFAYCSSPPHRSAKERLQPYVDHWHQCDTQADDELAARIRHDRVDLLVDLNAHMASGRLLAFARRPAPVQIGYLAYPATCGLKAMDYRITCAALDPIGCEEPLEPERLLRLPDTFWCYPTTLDEPIGPVPSAREGFVTFGCLNSFVKVRDRCIALWARVMESVPGSRLLVLVQGGEGARSVLRRFAPRGIDPTRIQIFGYVSRREHLQRFNQVDVSLDSFPYGGHITTHDSLWMGVPSVVMAGDTPISRAGECILSHVGHRSLVARSDDEYVRLAIELAADVSRRAELRQSLRPTMCRSPLTDAPRFVRRLEAAYRAAWQRWCEALPSANIDIP